jgi:hypothetical protein
MQKNEPSQPSEGDIVLICSHLDEQREASGEIFGAMICTYLNPSVKLKGLNENGKYESISTSWLVCCFKCRQEYATPEDVQDVVAIVWGKAHLDKVKGHYAN